MRDELPVTGWMLTRLAAPWVVIGAVAAWIAWGWPSGHGLDAVVGLAALAWLVGRIGQWIDDDFRRRSGPLRDTGRPGGPRSDDRPGGRPIARGDYPR